MKKEVIVNNLNHAHYSEIFEIEKQYTQVQSKKYISIASKIISKC